MFARPSPSVNTEGNHTSSKSTVTFLPVRGWNIIEDSTSWALMSMDVPRSMTTGMTGWRLSNSVAEYTPVTAEPLLGW